MRGKRHYDVYSNKKMRSTLLIAMVGIFLLGTISFHLLEKRINDSFAMTIQKEVVEISRQNAEAVSRELKAKQLFMQTIAADFAESSILSKEEILSRLENYAEHYQFYNMGVIYPDGKGYTLDGNCLDLHRMEYFQRGMQGESVITKSYPSAAGNGEMLNILTAPVMKDGNVLYLISATYQSAKFADLLNVSFFEGAGNSIVVDCEERSIITLQDGEVNTYQDLTQHLSLQQLVEKGTSDQIDTFSYQGRTYYLHMDAIDVEDWYLLTYVDKESAFVHVEQLKNEIIWLIAGLGALLSIIVLAFLSLYWHHQRKIDTLLFYDGLLEEKNFTYYKMRFYQLPKEQREHLSILVFDIDRFKDLNLFYGSQAGDELLRYINRIFKEEAKEFHLYRDRFDHFVAVIHTQCEEKILAVIQKIQQRMETDIRQGTCIPFTLSFGVCTLKEQRDLATALINATLAKSTVKHSAWKKYAFFEEDMKRHSMQSVEVESMFNQALAKREFEVYYQPKYDMRTNMLIGSEALVRWVRSSQKVISPAHFIPHFEKNGQIIYLDAMIIHQVCQQMADMKQKGLKILPISINLSRLHLKDPWIIEKIRDWIQEYQLEPNQLAFEITERAFFDDAALMHALVKKLHELGCRVDMDDYGTGASSLHSVAHVDFDVIKLDRSFIVGIGNEKVESVIKTTIDLARRLRLQLVAEGVETKQQVSFLTMNGCYFAQGFYFAKAMDMKAYMHALKQNMKMEEV